MCGLEKIVVLPSFTDKNLLKTLPNAKIQDVSKLVSNHLKDVKSFSSVKDALVISCRVLTSVRCYDFSVFF